MHWKKDHQQYQECTSQIGFEQPKCKPPEALRNLREHRAVDRAGAGREGEEQSGQATHPRSERSRIEVPGAWSDETPILAVLDNITEVIVPLAAAVAATLRLVSEAP
eukprot:CAMPEP_0204084862 /NCGR_PEP_ID=MMETSP0360-20130528/180731_1 /ASSEMBLY_ACC=CAM_ASM_000342 /TAXON_ID=268821 /ORGANISM="Scrippsiella Hangoei, Strain SHTV-5" /LENGTH=106 /DNA_ID=CAMNT_0051033889 /DNA_START=681 /DNA_END=998 /DNA_ORIENTATION=+